MNWPAVQSTGLGCIVSSPRPQEKGLSSVNRLLVSQAAVPRRAGGSVTEEEDSLLSPGQGLLPISASPWRPQPALHISQLENPNVRGQYLPKSPRSPSPLGLWPRPLAPLNLW